MAVMHNARPQAEIDAGFGLLKDIINIIKDPEGFDAAHEHAREQAALTEDVRQQLVEAKKIISNASKVAEELDKRKESVELAESHHANAISQFQDYKLSEELRLKNRENELNKLADDLQNTIKEQKNERLRLNSERETDKANHDQKMAQLNAREAELGRQADENTRVANELSTEKKRQEDRDRELVRLATGK